MTGRATIVWLGFALVACGARTDALELSTSDGARGGEAGSGGVVVAGTGGSIAFGGRPGSGGRGPGGRGSGGRGTGGKVSGTGGQVDTRFVAYLCRNLCKRPDDCPPAAPYVGGCNGITNTCIITCENGCPFGTESFTFNGGCLCHDPRVNAVPQSPDQTCCSSFCGPPYFIPCCSGTACGRDGYCR